MSKANLLLGINNSYKSEVSEFSTDITWKRVIIYFNDKTTDDKMRAIADCANRSLLRIAEVYKPGYIVNRPSGSYYIQEVLSDFYLPKHIEGLLNHTDTIDYITNIEIHGPNQDTVTYGFSTVLIADEATEEYL